MSLPEPLHKTSISHLNGMNYYYQERLARLGIITIQDLLLHLPKRYENRTRITPIGELKLGDLALIEGEIQNGEVHLGRRNYLLATIQDQSGLMVLRFFNFTHSQRKLMQIGTKLRCYGEIKAGSNSLELINPEFKIINTLNQQDIKKTLTPIYSTTQGLNQTKWYDWIEQALKLLINNPDSIPELLPTKVLIKANLCTLIAALQSLHNPPVNTDTNIINEQRHPAQLRLAFEELLAHQLKMRRLRSYHRSVQAPLLAHSNTLCNSLLTQLPFQLTTAQYRVINEIANDLNQNQPMLRLLQGDVGSGKTIVAIMAALQAIEAGYQVVLMVPTEILAEQQQRYIRNWLKPLDIEVVWLKRQRNRERQRILEKLADKQPMFIVGTHALIQADINFSNLGLVIIDEQHKFGVHQRLALRNKGIRQNHIPHQLVMTATPIPRSLAITAYADLDISILDEQPLGRGNIITAIIPDKRRDEVIARVRIACVAGRQAYWICTLIEESEVLQYQAAESTAKLLQQALIDINVGLIHGRMKSVDKEAMMAQFKAGLIGLLVATTVIEVGVDISNASLIIIENPERLGLAQLHQLRGRVGRSNIESHCVLMYHPPRTPQAAERLRIIRNSNDGFMIAHQDLQMRGPGELLGTRQAGNIQFKIANLIYHQDLLELAQSTADDMLMNDPKTALMLEERWQIRDNDYLNSMSQ
jgi:ATP-dependent DNA helicase RecG